MPDKTLGFMAGCVIRIEELEKIVSDLRKEKAELKEKNERWEKLFETYEQYGTGMNY